jgi:hypothetical protein
VGGKKSGRYKLAYTPELHRKIVDSLERGAYQVHAANSAGVSISTLHRWVELGRSGVEPYVAFAEDVDRARANDALRNQAVISAAAMRKVPGDWKAAAWNLERKFPKLYGRRAMMDNVDDLPPPAAKDDDDDQTGVHSPWLVQ